MDIVILKSFIPETFLSLSILLLLVFNARLVNNLNYNFPLIEEEVLNQISFIFLCIIFLLFNLKIEGIFSNFLFENSLGSKTIKILLIILSLFAMQSIFLAFKIQKLNFIEYFSITLLSILALLLLTSVSDLLSFYLIIEMQSLCFYILATFKRDSVFSTEAGLKYFISGAFMSGFLLLGSSIIYGCIGTLSFHNIALILSSKFENQSLEYLLKLGILLVTFTLLFKVSCAPFHFWSPDVYEGSPLSSTIVFSILPKLPLFYFFFNWLECFEGFFPELKNTLLLTGLISVIVGTFFALGQKRIKRMFIYSSISQVGFLVFSLTAGNLGGSNSMFFYLIVYLFTATVIWNNFSLLYNYQLTSTNKETPLFLSSLSNFSKISFTWMATFIGVLFSIGGIPPLLGFLSKAIVLFELINNNQIICAILLIIVSSISVFYYIRILKNIVFEPTDNKNILRFKYNIFWNKNLEYIYEINGLILFFLVVLFYFPNMLLLICQQITLS